MRPPGCCAVTFPSLSRMSTFSELIIFIECLCNLKPSEGRFTFSSGRGSSKNEPPSLPLIFSSIILIVAASSVGSVLAEILLGIDGVEVGGIDCIEIWSGKSKTESNQPGGRAIGDSRNPQQIFPPVDFPILQSFRIVLLRYLEVLAFNFYTISTFTYFYVM